MRTERSAKSAGAETTREEENAEPQEQAKTQAVEANQFSPEQGSTDQPSVSHFSVDRARVSRWAVQASPAEIRCERMASLQDAIASGTYEVSPEQTAEAIISEQQVRDEAAA
jgi:anti-sigma28 factor (negative regulator of flagellin synthesis)